jgi:ribosome-binding protein aMBF1 (putative translation factor)
MASRQTWKSIKESRPDTPARRAGYERARCAYEIGQQVRQLRLSRGLSQAELATLMGTVQPVVARLEAGGTEPRWDLLQRASAALNTEFNITIRPGHVLVHA